MRTKKFIAKVTKKAILDDGTAEVTIELPHYYPTMFEDVEKDKKYYMEIKDIEKQRTLNQNALMWKLLTKITVALDGRYTEKARDKYYYQLLKESGAKTMIMDLKKVAVKDFIRYLDSRGYQILNEYTDEDGNEIQTIEFYIGSSKMNIQEMNNVIEKALDWCQELNIPQDDYLHQ